MGPDGDMVTVGVGTVCRDQKVSHGTVKNVIQYSPVTSSVILSVAITDGLVLITTLHWITLPSSVALNCEIFKDSVYTSELSIVVAVVPLILLNTVPSLLHTISTLLVIPLTVVTLQCSVSD